MLSPPPQKEYNDTYSLGQKITAFVLASSFFALFALLAAIADPDISVERHIESAASAIVAVFKFIWSAVPYLAIGYIAIEQFRINHNLSILRSGIERLRNEQFKDY